MIIKCKLSGEDVELPCAAANCPLFGDCAVQYTVESQKKITNADKIRAMSDEEMAEFLYTEFLDGDGSKSCITEWLKQPAEVE